MDASGAIKGFRDADGNLIEFDNSIKDTEEDLEGFTGALDGVGGAIVVLNQGIELAKQAFGALKDAVKTTTDAYGVQEDAETRLAAALSLTTGFTQEALDDFKQFASSLQEVTTVGDETTLKLLSMAKAVGVTDDMAKKLVKTSVDLSSVTDMDLKGAFQGLLDTLKGEAGAFAKFAPELKALGIGALRSGAAVDLLGKKFEGFAEITTRTFIGAATQAENALGDLFSDRDWET